jgi:hypothetical protein
VAILSQKHGAISGLSPRQFASFSLLDCGFPIGLILDYGFKVKTAASSPGKALTMAIPATQNGNQYLE